MRTTAWSPLSGARRLCCALALLPLPATAQRPLSTNAPSGALPPAWQVIDRHLDASGGRAAFEKLKSRDINASYEIPARRLRGDLRVLSARPDRLLIKTEYPELGLAVVGFNGSVGWTTEPGSRPTLVKGGSLADLHADALFDRYDEENLVSAETVGLAVFQGRRCVQLKIVRIPGRESSEYFDTETGLFAGSVAHRATDKGPVTMRTVWSDYKTIDGVKLPHRLQIITAGVSQVVRIIRVRHNRVDPAVFAPPTSLRAAAR